MFSLPPNAATRAGAISLVPVTLHLQSRLHDPAFSDQCFNQHAEDGVVNNRITDTDDREQPQFAAVTRQNDEVDQTVRERRTVTHPRRIQIGNAGLPESRG